MFVEQKLLRCDICSAPFVLQYRYPRVGPKTGSRMRVAHCPATGCDYPNTVQLDTNAIELVVKPFFGACTPRSKRLDGMERLWSGEKRSPRRVDPRLSEAIRDLWTPVFFESTEETREPYPGLDDLTRTILDTLDQTD